MRTFFTGIENGWNNEQIVETIAQVALNLFTSYINIALAVPIDFPASEPAPHQLTAPMSHAHTRVFAAC